MKEPENNKRDEGLDDLLSRARENRLEDDFEREAAEGYSQLSEEEAFAAKASLDRKAKRLLGPRLAPRMSWSLAAGLALVMGLTAFFLREDLFPREDLALSHIRLDAEVGPDPNQPGPVQGPHPPITDTKPLTDTATAAPARLQTHDQTVSQRFAFGRNKDAEPPSPAQAPTSMANVREADIASDMSMAAAEPVSEQETKAEENTAELAMQQKEDVPSFSVPVKAAATTGAAKRESAGKKMKSSEQPAVQAAPSQAADYAFSADDTDSLGRMVLDHLKKNLPGEYRHPFLISIRVHNDGHMSEAKVLDGDLTPKQNRELISWFDRSSLNADQVKKVVRDSRTINVRFLP